MKNIEEFCPVDQGEWREWLSENHEKKEAVWLIFYRKKSPKYNLSWSESVDEALCFGWIDSTKKTIDEIRFKQYFTKRKPRSNWSKVNKEKIKHLIEQNLLKSAGYKTIEIAKENGSWSFLNSVENLEVPNDLELKLKYHKGAFEYFESLSKSSKKALLYWVLSAKRNETRCKRITEIVSNASKRMKPKQFR